MEYTLIAITRWTHIHKVPNKACYTLGALQTLPHYKKISTQDLGLKELWEFGTEVILALRSGLFIRMM